MSAHVSRAGDVFSAPLAIRTQFERSLQRVSGAIPFQRQDGFDLAQLCGCERESCMRDEGFSAKAINALETIEQQMSSAGRVCMTTSFQNDGMVLLHLLRQGAPQIPVLFLDTFHHFPEVLAFRDMVAERWRLNVITLRSESPQPGQWTLDTAACCRRHKVDPLFLALEDYDVWFTALRREQSPSRASVQDVDAFCLPSGRVLSRVSPLAGWSAAHVHSYATHFDIPRLPLYDAGYSSIGCAPCTSRPLDPGNLRSGRWGGQKLECGIHVQAPVGRGVSEYKKSG